MNIKTYYHIRDLFDNLLEEEFLGIYEYQQLNEAILDNLDDLSDDDEDGGDGSEETFEEVYTQLKVVANGK